MKAIIVGGGIGGLDGRPDAARDAASPARSTSRRRRSASSGVGINTLPHAIKELKKLGLLERLDAVGDPHLRAHLHEPLRPGDLARAARHRGGLRRAAILDPPRPPAGRHPRGGARSGSARTRSAPAAGSAPSRRTRAASRPGSSTAPARHVATARGDVLIGADGIHSPVRAHALPERGAALLERADAVARRDRVAGLPHRPLDDRRGRALGQDGGLPDRGGLAAGRQAHELGGGGAGRRRHDARRRGARTGRAPAAARS